MHDKRIIKGRIVYINENTLYLTRGRNIYRSINGGLDWHLHFRIPVNSILESSIFKSPVLVRLLRKGVHHLQVINQTNIAFIYNKRICFSDGRELLFNIPLRGSRPLSFELINNRVYFGEYRSNPQRISVSVFLIAFNEDFSFKSIYKFNNIRHIHGVYKDPYSEFIYITTGDENNESAIYKTKDDFSNVQEVFSGSQQARTIKLLFDEEYIYFGTDTPKEQNHIYKLHKKQKKASKLVKVGNSVFHGCKVANWLFFSTATEPSKVNDTKYAEVWASPDGDNWKCILKFKKDILPMKYFQYGQVFFPYIEKDDGNLWISPFSTKFSGKTIKLSLSKIAEIYNSSIIERV